MVEAKLIEFLSRQVDGVTAYGGVPSVRPEVFITVERTGGRADRFLDYPQVAVQVWASSRAQASALAYDLRKACLKLQHKSWVARIELGGLYDFPDPDSRCYRYQFTLELAVINN